MLANTLKKIKKIPQTRLRLEISFSEPFKVGGQMWTDLLCQLDNTLPWVSFLAIRRHFLLVMWQPGPRAHGAHCARAVQSTRQAQHTRSDGLFVGFLKVFTSRFQEASSALTRCWGNYYRDYNYYRDLTLRSCLHGHSCSESLELSGFHWSQVIRI